MTVLEGNSATRILSPGTFSIEGLVHSGCKSLRAAGMQIAPCWVRREIERQLAGEKPSSAPGVTLAVFLRNTRLLP